MSSISHTIVYAGFTTSPTRESLAPRAPRDFKQGTRQRRGRPAFRPPTSSFARGLFSRVCCWCCYVLCCLHSALDVSGREGFAGQDSLEVLTRGGGATGFTQRTTGGDGILLQFDNMMYDANPKPDQGQVGLVAGVSAGSRGLKLACDFGLEPWIHP